jgi:CHASE2 domain-containing sensor protein
MRLLARLRSPALRGVWIGLACALAAWLAVKYTMLGGVEDWMLDGCFSFRGTRSSPTAQVVIVELDHDFLSKLPKPTTSLSPELAEVVTFAKKQGARAVGIDVVIPEDREDLPGMEDESGDPLRMGQAILKAKNVTLPVLSRSKDR